MCVCVWVGSLPGWTSEIYSDSDRLASTARLFSISMVEFDFREESMARYLIGAEYCGHDMSSAES